MFKSTITIFTTIALASAQLNLQTLPFADSLSSCAKDCIGQAITTLPGAISNPCDGSVASFLSTCFKQHTCDADTKNLQTLSTLCKEQAASTGGSNNNGGGGGAAGGGSATNAPEGNAALNTTLPSITNDNKNNASASAAASASTSAVPAAPATAGSAKITITSFVTIAALMSTLLL